LCLRGYKERLEYVCLCVLCVNVVLPTCFVLSAIN
jgi:hypothetical protein